ncbi:cold shock domain-containing protein [Streptomyces sp. RB6PN25]|uniref:Cold shock domain-containing protein n=1 Tax=Streptomyces humicola TaxID=2953240 RepID=A0ABT1Q6Z9_9ACTN|nr:cold shock domain-containing protein [Streptomyces humicola]MCQ4085163.1 cold shock domain-containing protein [Streptomyces humicola]
MSERVSGVVKWFNQVKGYGYITGDDGSDVLVHRREIVGGTFLAEGMRVTYVAVGGPEDIQAREVHIVE